MKRTIFFDVDNTLVCREKNVMCDYTIKAIKMCKNNGINVAIATGRSLAMVKQENFYNMFNTIVSANGALITVNNKVIYKKCMDRKIVQDMVKHFECNNIPYCLHLLDRSIGKIENNWVRSFSEKYNMKIDKLEDEVLSNIYDYEVFQLNAKINSNDIDKLKKKYDKFKFVKLIDIEEGYDIFNKECTKGSAIRYIRNSNHEEGIKYYAFGDGFNDLEMFEEVDFGVAMGNGCKELKEKANLVTDHINQRGVYNALKTLKII